MQMFCTRLSLVLLSTLVKSIVVTIITHFVLDVLMPIPPLKHIVETVDTSANRSVTPLVVQIAVGTVNPNSYTTQAQCRNGSLIKKLNIQLDVIDSALSGAPGTIDWYLWFNIGGVQTRVFPNVLNASVTKNQVFHQDGALANQVQLSATGAYVPWVTKWRLEINIPRSLQQVNENDVIEFVLGTNIGAATTTTKFRCIYKEIFP